MLSNLVHGQYPFAELPPEQIQLGGVGCDPFVIANAYELAAGNDPSVTSLSEAKRVSIWFNIWRKVVLNLSLNSRTLSYSIGDKLVTWYNASSARNGCT